MDAAPFCNIADDRLASMNIEVVGDEDLMSVEIRGDHAIEKLQKVLLGARLANHWRDDLTTAHVHARDQADGSVPPILELAPFDFSRSRGLGGSDSLQGLNARLLVDRDGSSVFFGLPLRRIEIGLANLFRLAPELLQVDLSCV